MHTGAPLDGDWGPGATDASAVRQKVVAILNGGLDPEFQKLRASAMFKVLTWQQAAYIYRTSPPSLRSFLLHPLVDGEDQRFMGMTKAQVLAALGKPDDVWGAELVYTGEGHVSDGMSGYLFRLGPDGRVAGIVPAN
jgi:hypothetical protein